ncbi:1,4-beta-glucanase, partial [Mycobacterium tuberculosis]
MTRRTGQRWRGTLPGRRPWTRPAPATCRRHLAFVELRHYFARVMSSAIGSVARWIVPLLGVAAVASIGVIADPVRVVRA